MSSTCAVSSSPLGLNIPTELGTLSTVVDGNCPRLSGRYVLLGKLVSGSVSTSYLTLIEVLDAPYPPQDMKFRKEDKRYADLITDDGDLLKAQIVIGDYVTNWETRDLICEQGWLKLSRYDEGGAEGNHTKVNITNYLRRNMDGDLVVYRTVQGRTSNMFGLIWSNINDTSWLIFHAYPQK